VYFCKLNALFASGMLSITCIQVQDQLLSATMGRPTAIKLHEFHVTPPTVDDFDVVNRPAILFVELAKLGSILGRIQDLHARRPANHQEVRPPIAA
jgi:hypothetical protein